MLCSRHICNFWQSEEECSLQAGAVSDQYACLQDNLVDEVADVDTVPNVKSQHEVTAAISNSFGFGGHNSVVCFAPYKE